MAKFVRAYDTRTGKVHSVPEHWLGHKVLGRNLTLTPKESASKESTNKPQSGDDKKENHDAPRPR